MNILGTGIVFARGRGNPALERALSQGWCPPTLASFAGEEQAYPAMITPPEALTECPALRGARRADKLSRMAVVAAWDAWQASGGAVSDRRSIGVVVATGLGPHLRTFEFLDGLLEFGDRAASPTGFSHSVHNTAASYVATALDVRGPVLTVTDFAFAFQQAAVLAECWLIEGRCEYVLLTCVEEVGHVLAHVCARLLHVPADGRLTPFRFDARPAVVPGEGAVCFVLSLHSGPDTEATAMQVVAGPPAVPSPVTILDTGSLLPDESAYLGLVPAGGELANYAPVFGSMMTGTGFQCAVAVRSLRNGLRYASPIADNPHGLVIRDRTEPVVTPAIACVKCGCRGECMTVYLRHPRPAAQAPEGTPHADTVDRRGG